MFHPGYHCHFAVVLQLLYLTASGLSKIKTLAEAASCYASQKVLYKCNLSLLVDVFKCVPSVQADLVKSPNKTTYLHPFFIPVLTKEESPDKNHRKIPK